MLEIDDRINVHEIIFRHILVQLIETMLFLAKSHSVKSKCPKYISLPLVCDRINKNVKIKTICCVFFKRHAKIV